MKTKLNYLLASFLVLMLSIPTFHSCKDEEEVIETTISIDKTETASLDIGDTVKATITIECSKVNSFGYNKIVDDVYSDFVDVTAHLTQEGNTYTYNFTYVLEEGDDLHTLGFEFTVTDKDELSEITALVVKTNLSMRSTFVKYDWHINAELWLGMDVLTEADSMKTFRFYEDGTYEVDLTAAFAAATHHFCYWVFKETPENGDTLAIVRLIRKQLSGDVGLDEYYDFKITSIDETEMVMYWDLAVFGLLNIERTFVSKPKGDFQAYGTTSVQSEVEALTVLDCSTVADNLMTID